MICYDVKLNSISRIEEMAVTLHFRHVEEKLFGLLYFIVQKAKLALD